MATITALTQEPAVKHLLVDLSHGNYFGSIILGSLVQLGHAVRNRGGRIGLCGASSDMQDVLRLMKLDHLWEMFPTLGSGLATVARIPLGERLWRRRKALAILGVIAVAIALFLAIPRPNYTRMDYERLSKLWQEVDARRDMAGVEEWSRLVKRTEKELEPFIKGIERRSRNRPTAMMSDRFLIYIARDNWSQALDRNNPNRELHRTAILRFFRMIEAELEGRPFYGPVFPSAADGMDPTPSLLQGPATHLEDETPSRVTPPPAPPAGDR
jgi:anti-anti-sigma factor